MENNEEDPKNSITSDEDTKTMRITEEDAEDILGLGSGFPRYFPSLSLLTTGATHFIVYFSHPPLCLPLYRP